MSAPEDLLAFQLRASKIACEREFRFHPTRRWRFDFAWQPEKLAVEVEGGIMDRRPPHPRRRLRGRPSEVRRSPTAWLASPPVQPGDGQKSGYALETIVQLLEASR